MSITVTATATARGSIYLTVRSRSRISAWQKAEADAAALRQSGFAVTWDGSQMHLDGRVHVATLRVQPAAQ